MRFGALCLSVIFKGVVQFCHFGIAALGWSLSWCRGSCLRSISFWRRLVFKLLVELGHFIGGCLTGSFRSRSGLGASALWGRLALTVVSELLVKVSELFVRCLRSRLLC